MTWQATCLRRCWIFLITYVELIDLEVIHLEPLEGREIISLAKRKNDFLVRNWLLGDKNVGLSY